MWDRRPWIAILKYGRHLFFSDQMGSVWLSVQDNTSYLFTLIFFPNFPPGAVAHDPPQDPVPVSSVSLIPPPPPPKNVARLLALALAESAQQASTQSLRRPGPAQAAYTNYGDTAVAATEDKLLGTYSHVTLDQACFPADRPAEQSHLRNTASGDCDQLTPGTAVIGDRTPSSVPESEEQFPQADFLGSQPHQTYLSGDPEKARISSVSLTDSKSEDHISFPDDPSGKTSVLTVSFADQDQSHLRFYSGDQPPPFLGTSVDESPHASELADKSPTPSNLPRDKVYPPSGSPEENTSTATMAYVTPAPAAAEISTREASWDVAEQATIAEFAAATLQRPHRTNRPLPPPPSQRSAEQLPVVGQVQATSMGLNNAHKVRRGESQGDEMHFLKVCHFSAGCAVFGLDMTLIFKSSDRFHGTCLI